MSEWIKSVDGVMPVKPERWVKVIFCDGTLGRGPASNFCWTKTHKKINVEWFAVIQDDEGNLIDPDNYRLCGAEEIEHDPVDRPEHYASGDIECIEAIQAALTEEEFRGYRKGSVIKYIWRERQKGGVESLRKARWYLDHLIDEQQ